MGAFQEGMQLGSAAYGAGRNYQLAQREINLREQQAADAHTLAGLQISSAQRGETMASDVENLRQQQIAESNALGNQPTKQTMRTAANNVTADSKATGTDDASGPIMFSQGQGMPGATPAMGSTLATAPSAPSGSSLIDQRAVANKYAMAHAVRTGDFAAQGRALTDLAGINEDRAKDTTASMSIDDIRAALGSRANGDVGIPLTIGAKDPKTGMTMVTLTDGKGAPQKNIAVTDDQLRQLHTGLLLEHTPGMGGRAMDIATAAHNDIAGHIKTLNDQTVSLAGHNNDSTYKGIVGAAETTKANAAMVGATSTAAWHGAEAKLVNAKISELQDTRSAHTEALGYLSKYNDLSPADQAGKPGMALQRQYALANSKVATNLPGSLFSQGGANGKLPATLTDQQKIAYEKGAVPDLQGLIGATNTATNRAQIYQKYGLDPAQFGEGGLTNPYAKTDGSPSATQPASTSGATAMAPPTKVVDPRDTQLAQESKEMNMGMRPNLSPGMQDYYQERQRTQGAAQAQDAANYKAQEFNRAQAGRGGL